MSKRAVVEGTRAESPKPPAGPGDLSEEKPAPLPERKDEPKAPPPAGPGKFPEPSDDAYITPEGKLEALAVTAPAEIITPEDIERAQEAWRRHASPACRLLLDGTPDDGPNRAQGESER